MIQPLGNRILCKAIDTEETIPGGRVILLDESREAITDQQAEVVAVAPNVPDLAPGDWVIHRPYTRKEAPDDQFWLTEDDIVAKIT